jgi:lipopolysaccharide/colanic/teichoic acid biosynthesis glycosyltransferase
MKLKRAFDISVSASALLVLSPVFVALSAVTALKFKKSPFYFAPRVGKNMEEFNMIKFRSMKDTVDKEGKLLPDDERRTSYGRFLRVTSLDELPQLVNILKGDMSFVGPRPRAPGLKGEDSVPEQYKDLFSVRPGLTGPWQIAVIGANKKSTVEERLELDYSYVRNTPTLLSDLKMISQTLPSFYSGHDGETFKGPKN